RLGVDVPHDDAAPETWAAHREVMAAKFRERTRAEWEQQLVTPGSCTVPVLSLTEAIRHPHNVARESFMEVDGAVVPAPSPRFSRTVPERVAELSFPGDDTMAVLEELGLDRAAVDALVADGVVRQSSRR